MREVFKKINFLVILFLLLGENFTSLAQVISKDIIAYEKIDNRANLYQLKVSSQNVCGDISGVGGGVCAYHSIKNSIVALSRALLVNQIDNVMYWKEKIKNEKRKLGEKDSAKKGRDLEISDLNLKYIAALSNLQFTLQTLAAFKSKMDPKSFEEIKNANIKRDILLKELSTRYSILNDLHHNLFEKHNSLKNLINPLEVPGEPDAWADDPKHPLTKLLNHISASIFASRLERGVRLVNENVPENVIEERVETDIPIDPESSYGFIKTNIKKIAKKHPILRQGVNEEDHKYVFKNIARILHNYSTQDQTVPFVNKDMISFIRSYNIKKVADDHSVKGLPQDIKEQIAAFRSDNYYIHAFDISINYEKGYADENNPEDHSLSMIVVKIPSRKLPQFHLFESNNQIFIDKPVIIDFVKMFVDNNFAYMSDYDREQLYKEYNKRTHNNIIQHAAENIILPLEGKVSFKSVINYYNDMVAKDEWDNAISAIDMIDYHQNLSKILDYKNGGQFVDDFLKKHKFSPEDRENKLHEAEMKVEQAHLEAVAKARPKSELSILLSILDKEIEKRDKGRYRDKGGYIDKKFVDPSYYEALRDLSDINEQQRDRYNATALMVAAGSGYPLLVEPLLKEGADPNIQDSHGETALHRIFSGIFIPHAEKPEYTDYDKVMDLLIAAGAKVDLQNDSGMTPLMLAAGLSNLKYVHKLLKAGADPLVVDNNGHNSIWYAELTDTELKSRKGSRYDNQAIIKVLNHAVSQKT